MSVGKHNGYQASYGMLANRQVRPFGAIDSRDVARFWANTRQEPSGCVVWTASRAGGGRQRLYGQFSYTAIRRQVHIYAHRFAWIVTRGPIRPGHYVCHSCDNPICVNPDHLFVGTQFDNMRDASVKGRLSAPRKRNRAVKATVVARYLKGGIAAAALGAEYGVHQLTVLRWVHGEVGAEDLRRRSA